jgi:hypothetical protein
MLTSTKARFKLDEELDTSINSIESNLLPLEGMVTANVVVIVWLTIMEQFAPA